MNNLKGILYAIHGGNKEKINQLYHDKHIYFSSSSSSNQIIEDEKIYYYHELALRFRGTGFRSKERLTMMISIPAQFILSKKNNDISSCYTNSYNEQKDDNNEDFVDMLVYEDYILRLIAPHINTLSEEMQNDKKDSREKARFYAQVPGDVILRRNGCVWDHDKKEFKILLLFYMPLINGTTVNGKSGFRAIRTIMEMIYELLTKLDVKQIQLHAETYRKQMQIRNYLKTNNLMAFVANGSILPRDGETIYPLKSAIPFLSPESLKIELQFDDAAP